MGSYIAKRMNFRVKVRERVNVCPDEYGGDTFDGNCGSLVN